MADLAELVNYLDTLLSAADFSDSSLNGLQVESSSSKVEVVALAVDSGLSIIENAVKAQAQLLVVHHGLFWGECLPVTGTLSKKLSLLLRSGCSLYASHLPLDSHMKVGNAAQLAELLNLRDVEPFCEYKGCTVGVKGKLPSDLTINQVAAKCGSLAGAISPTVLPFGTASINTVGIVTGSGAFALDATAAQSLDLLLSGEPKHEAYHKAKELGVNALFMGHYATETLGVKALGSQLEERFKVKTVFIHEGSGI
ncbi:MAG: Nif3-like dinuclear metal center hexameric protein [Deltaproteobacteria bacterium]|nr:Nif3-like dinuclear metal center hexameric protein [Deltaproteobacteria bacterium]